MGASHGGKDPRHPRQLTTLLQRLERVGETGRLRIVDNRREFRPAAAGRSSSKRRAIVAVVNHIRTAAPGKATY